MPRTESIYHEESYRMDWVVEQFEELARDMVVNKNIDQQYIIAALNKLRATMTCELVWSMKAQQIEKEQST